MLPVDFYRERGDGSNSQRHRSGPELVPIDLFGSDIAKSFLSVVTQAMGTERVHNRRIAEVIAQRLVVALLAILYVLRERFQEELTPAHVRYLYTDATAVRCPANGRSRERINIDNSLVSNVDARHHRHVPPSFGIQRLGVSIK